MTILEAICAAIKAGRLEQPFSAEAVADALREHLYSRGSIAVILARYSRPGPGQRNQPLRRIARGLYRLATRSPASTPPRGRRGAKGIAADRKGNKDHR
jgi:hypothetical protein